MWRLGHPYRFIWPIWEDPQARNGRLLTRICISHRSAPTPTTFQIRQQEPTEMNGGEGRDSRLPFRLKRASPSRRTALAHYPDLIARGLRPPGGPIGVRVVTSSPVSRHAPEAILRSRCMAGLHCAMRHTSLGERRGGSVVLALPLHRSVLRIAKRPGGDRRD